ncbi:MAG: type II toxin-antitoxin system RelE/ParE family toxin [Magnetococcales bacterium]|nr:type II toxin-antitoxin system RelE/ParE family toxin [Magnetococcales bacterium]
MQIVWTQNAIDCLVSIWEYIQSEHSISADDVRRRILDAPKRLSDFPDSGRYGIEPKTREVVVSGLPYVIVYRVRNGSVEILSVWHDAQSRLN